jgi:hypothetical protein
LSPTSSRWVERERGWRESARENKRWTAFLSNVPQYASRLRTHANVSQRDYEAPFNTIPGHGRYQHFGVGGRDRIAELLASLPETVDNQERCRRLLDLFLVSVLLDAGAGTEWSYKSLENGRTYRRSEGIAVASLEMFKNVSVLPQVPCHAPSDACFSLGRLL